MNLIKKGGVLQESIGIHQFLMNISVMNLIIFLFLNNEFIITYLALNKTLAP